MSDIVTLSRADAELIQTAIASGAWNYGAAAAIDRALNPPKLWMLTSCDEDGYDLYLARTQWLRDADTVVDFADAADALLFTDAEREQFDADAFLAELDAAGQAPSDPDSVNAIREPSWAEAPTASEALNRAMDATSDADRCASYCALAVRADQQRRSA